MIYINFVELPFVMLHAKFQNNRPSGSGGKDSYMFFRREVFNRSIDLSICFQYSVNHLTL